MWGFYVLVGVSQAVGFVMLVLAGYWTGQTLGGYAWDGSGKEFNYHPLFMSIGLIFLYGDAILVFRVFGQTQKFVVKCVHLSLHALSLIFACIALKAVFKFHRVQKYPDMYSFHSWVGLTGFIMFALQWLAGFFSFFYPRLKDDMRAAYLPLHRYFGIATFAIVIAAAFIGINEKLFFVYSGNGNSPRYSSLPHGAYIGNFFGFTILIFGLIVGYLATNTDAQRPPSETETQEGKEEGVVMKPSADVNVN